MVSCRSCGVVSSAWCGQPLTDRQRHTLRRPAHRGARSVSGAPWRCNHLVAFRVSWRFVSFRVVLWGFFFAFFFAFFLLGGAVV